MSSASVRSRQILAGLAAMTAVTVHSRRNVVFDEVVLIAG